MATCKPFARGVEDVEDNIARVWNHQVAFGHVFQEDNNTKISISCFLLALPFLAPQKLCSYDPEASLGEIQTEELTQILGLLYQGAWGPVSPITLIEGLISRNIETQVTLLLREVRI